MLEDGLRSQILADPTVDSVLGTRLYPMLAPLDMTQYPCVATMQVASYTPLYTATPGSVGLAQKRIVINVYAAEYSVVRTLVEAIRSAMSGFQGNLPDGTQVYLCRIANAQDFFDADSRLYRSTIHFLIQYQE